MLEAKKRLCPPPSARSKSPFRAQVVNPRAQPTTSRALGTTAAPKASRRSGDKHPIAGGGWPHSGRIFANSTDFD